METFWLKYDPTIHGARYEFLFQTHLMVKWWSHVTAINISHPDRSEVQLLRWSLIGRNNGCFKSFRKIWWNIFPKHHFPSLKLIVSERYFTYWGRRDDVFHPPGGKNGLRNIISLNLKVLQLLRKSKCCAVRAQRTTECFGPLMKRPFEITFLSLKRCIVHTCLPPIFKGRRGTLLKMGFKKDVMIFHTHLKKKDPVKPHDYKISAKTNTFDLNNSKARITDIPGIRLQQEWRMAAG